MQELSIDTVLEYSPYDNKCPSPFGKRKSPKEEEDLFYKSKIFVEYPLECSKLENELSFYVEDANTHTIIFAGASGSGKTTFLKNFFRKKNDIYFCQFINLLDNPSILNSEDCVRTSVLNAICRIFDKEVARIFYQSYKDKKNNPINEIIGFIEDDLSRFHAFCNLYSRNDSMFSLYKTIKNFNLSLLQLISIYILSSVIAYKKENRPIVFVFDNLDEVDKQYLNNELYETIGSVFSVAQDYSEKILQYDFIRNVTFLLSFRTDNERILRSNQVNDRNRILFCNKVEFLYKYQVAYNDLLDARIKYYEEAGGKDKDTKNKYTEIMALIKSENFFFDQFIKPLYSYDYRMFTHFAIKKALHNNNIYILDALKQQKDSGKKEAQQGARGMLLFYALAGMLQDDKSRFTTYVKEEFSNDVCNVYRMSFTLLSNMCGWSHNEDELIKVMKNDETDFNEKTHPVHLPSFMNKITKWYLENKNDAICKILKGLIGSTASSFECPITLLGEDVDKYIKDLDKTFSMSAFASKITHDYLTDPNILSSVNIQVNPLCIVYAARIFIHYEYFNLISTQWNNTAGEKMGMKKGQGYEPKPLFQLTNSEQDIKNIELCLAYTFETAKNIIMSADHYFCKKCENNNKKCENNCNSFITEFINAELSLNNTLHATRIVTNHINYLENYRKFLWFQKMNNEHTDIDVQIQKIIINQIIEYIKFYKQRKVKDSKYNCISRDWDNQYTNALAILDNQPQFFTKIDLEFESKIQNV